jgi:hypothetical protein
MGESSGPFLSAIIEKHYGYFSANQVLGIMLIAFISFYLICSGVRGFFKKSDPIVGKK